MLHLSQLSNKHFFLVRLLVFTSILLCLVLLYMGWLSSIYNYSESRVWNFYQRNALFYTSHQPQVVTIDIDEASLRELEPWPWPREKMAKLAKILLLDYQVAAVAFDMWFTQDSKGQGDTQLKQLAQQYPIIFSQAFALPNQGSAVQSGVLGGGLGNIDPTIKLPKANGYIANNVTLASTPCIGHITPKKDFDGINKIPPYIFWKDKAYPILALEIMRCLMQDEKRLEHVGSTLQRYNKIKVSGNLGDKSILELDDEGYWKIPYAISPNDFDSVIVPVVDVFNHTVDPDLLDNQIVIIGSTATTLGDQHSTPQSANIAGFTVHVQMLEWLLSGMPVMPSEAIEYIVWLWTTISLLLLYALLIKRAPVSGIILAVVLLSLFWLGLGYLLWMLWQWWLPALPLFAYALFSLLQIPTEWSMLQRNSKRLRELFDGYLPSVVLEEVVKNNSTQVLQPKRQLLTILFADIADFTQRAEWYAPESIAALTQEILECLTTVIHENHGTLDKYMGDAVMAFWNAPLEEKKHADLAVKAGFKMIDTIKKYNKSSKLLEGEAIIIRIGIHTGEVIVGNLGTKLRKAYTAIGDPVNVAARLQEEAKTLQQYLLVSENTCELLSDSYPLKKHSPVLLRGRKKAVGIYVLKDKNRDA